MSRRPVATPRPCVLGIETSCDETAAAVVMGGSDVLSSVVSSQVDLHARFGGVVPEIAGRAHLELIMPVVARAIVEAGVDDARIDAVAATVGPGLIGSLLVGVSAAKALALDVGRARSSPSTTSRPTSTPPSWRSPTWSCPLVVLLVSGGHTMLVDDGGPRPVPPPRPDRSTTPPARPSTRWPATSASATPAGRPSTGCAMQGDPAAVALPPGDAAARASTSPSAA